MVEGACLFQFSETLYKNKQYKLKKMKMKKLDFMHFLKRKRILCTVALLLFVFSIHEVNGQAQRTLYWRYNGTNADFNDESNWSLSPTKDSATNLSPTLWDDVVFTATATVPATITAASGAVYMRSITYENSRVLNINTTYTYIYGDIKSNGNLYFNGNYVYINNNNGDTTTVFTIDMGGSAVARKLGNALYLNKPSKRVELKNPLNASGTRVNYINTNFYSNGYDVTLTDFNTGNYTNRIINFQGSTLTCTGTASTHRTDFFGGSNTVYEMDSSTIVSANINTYLYSSIQFGTVILQHSTQNSIYACGANLSVSFKKLVVNVPLVYFTVVNNNSISSIEIKDSLLFQRESNIMISNNQFNAQKVIDFKVNQIRYAEGSCAKKCGLLAITPVALTSTAALGTHTENITYSGFDFVGNWSAPKVDDGGRNSGGMVWTGGVVGQNFYWVGGTGSWSDPTKWSVVGSGGAPQGAGGCVPTMADTVYVDDNSFAAPGQTITIPAHAACANLQWTDAGRKGSMIRAGGACLTVAGSANFSGIAVGGMTVPLYLTGSGNHYLKSTQDAIYATTLYFQNTGHYELQESLLIDQALGDLFHFSGGLKSNGYTIKCRRFYSASWPDTAKRTLDLQNSIIHTYFNDHATKPATYSVYLNKANLLSYNFSGSDFQLDHPTTLATNTSRFYAVGTGWEFHNVSAIAPACSTALLFSSVNNRNTFNKITLRCNASINRSIITDTLSMMANNSYSLKFYRSTAGERDTLQVKKALLFDGALCGEMVNMASNNATYATLLKLDQRNEVSGGVLTRMNVIGDSLIVTGGISGAGNSGKLRITTGDSQVFYWVGGSGDWNDPTHWSIGDSVNYNNPTGCLPGRQDSVYFTASSFTAKNQIVNINTSPIMLKSMFWTKGAGDSLPTLTNSAPYLLQIYGSLEWAEKMKVTVYYPATSAFSYIYFYATAGESHYYQTNNVVTNNMIYYFQNAGEMNVLSDVNGREIYFSGTGIYRIHGNLTTAHLFQYTTGSLYLNGNTVSANHFKLTQSGTYVLDISNSTIRSNEGVAGLSGGTLAVANLTYFSSTNSILQSNSLLTITNGSHPLSFKQIQSGRSLIGGAGTITAEKITIRNNAAYSSTINGSFVTDTLYYAVGGTNNYITAGTTLTVKDLLYGNGNPCNIISLASSSATDPAYLKFSRCDMELDYFKITRIMADTVNMAIPCSAVDFQVLGFDGGGNSANFTFQEPKAAYVSTVIDQITCDSIPYLFDSQAAGDYQTLVWKKNNITIPGANDRYYPITSIGQYDAYISYSSSCNRQYYVTINQIVDTVAPVITATADTITLYASGCACTATDTVNALFDDCNLKNVWYELSGATTLSQKDSLKGVVFNRGVTKVTVFATDTVLKNVYYADTVSIIPTNNMSQLSYFVQVIDTAVKFTFLNPQDTVCENTAYDLYDQLTKIDLDDTVYFYADYALTLPLASNTLTLIKDTIFYAQSIDTLTGCLSAIDSIMITILPLPGASIVDDSKFYNVGQKDTLSLSFYGKGDMTVRYVHTYSHQGITHNDTVSVNILSGTVSPMDLVITHVAPEVIHSYALLDVVDATGCVAPATGGYSLTIACPTYGQLYLTCPPTVIDSVAYGECEKLLTGVKLGMPTISHWSDTVPGVNIPITVINDVPADSLFEIGKHYITWTATDTCGLIATCTQLVIINPPVCDSRDTIWFWNSGVLSFRKDSLIAIDFDGNRYNSVRIGCDCWTKENLISQHYADGSAVANMIYQSSMYPNTSANLATFGRLYTWEDATKGGTAQGVCPNGWSLPTVVSYTGLLAYNAFTLCAPGADYWLGAPVTNTTNFSAIPAGYYDGINNAYYQLLGDAYFWISEPATTGMGKACHLHFGCPEGDIITFNKGNGASVRCVKK